MDNSTVMIDPVFITGVMQFWRHRRPLKHHRRGRQDTPRPVSDRLVSYAMPRLTVPDRRRHPSETISTPAVT